MSRTVTRSLGINWSSVGTDGIAIGKFLVTGSTASAASVISGATPGLPSALPFPAARSKA